MNENNSIWVPSGIRKSSLYHPPALVAIDLGHDLEPQDLASRAGRFHSLSR